MISPQEEVGTTQKRQKTKTVSHVDVVVDYENDFDFEYYDSTKKQMKNYAEISVARKKSLSLSQYYYGVQEEQRWEV